MIQVARNVKKPVVSEAIDYRFLSGCTKEVIILEGGLLSTTCVHLNELFAQKADDTWISLYYS